MEFLPFIRSRELHKHSLNTYFSSQASQNTRFIMIPLSIQKCSHSLMALHFCKIQSLEGNE